ncbi:hypothetical protein SAMN05446927_7295 [Caballeronia arationis]|uniref:Uncharacterized protein n=1 Tax=Caballeronia arationis TaxID=1777142 RepID=A0A7Z7IDE9_9BURK|nr:hypothetical protein SAMN05446927_7295 [Caballeronia arationis]
MPDFPFVFSHLKSPPPANCNTNHKNIRTRRWRFRSIYTHVRYSTYGGHPMLKSICSSILCRDLRRGKARCVTRARIRSCVE